MVITNLEQAPFQEPLQVTGFTGLNAEEEIILQHLGISPSERIKKLRAAPLGDPISLRIGGTTISLRKEVCRKISVTTD